MDGLLLTTKRASPETLKRELLHYMTPNRSTARKFLGPKAVIAAFVISSRIMSAGNKYIQVEEGTKTDDKDMTFAVTFDASKTTAAFAKGDPVSRTMPNATLPLPGVVGFDGLVAFLPAPGEDLKFNVAGNVDPHNGTLSMWLNGQDYTPGVSDKRANVAYADLKFSDHGQTVEFMLYEYESIVYLDWYSSEPPQNYDDIGRVTAALQGIGKNEWFQIGATWTDSEIALYLNGEVAMRKRLPRKVSKTASLKAINNEDSYIGIRNGFFGDNHEYATAVDDFKLHGRALSPVEMLNSYNALLIDKNGARILAYEVTLNGVDRGGRRDSDKLEAEFDFTALPADPAERLKNSELEIDYILIRPDGNKSIGKWRFSKEKECRFLEKIDIPGGYLLETFLDGVKITAEIVRPDLSFIRSNIGGEDTVPEIWKDFAVDGRRVTLWNRDYTFGNGPCPISIKIKGKELLARGPEIIIDGNVISAWEPGNTTLTTRNVTYRGSAQFHGGTVDYVSTVEFDGFIKCYYKISGAPEIRSMKLAWQVKSEFCQFLMTPELYEKKEYRAKFSYFNRMQGSVKGLWLVSETDGGFAYEVEDDANWVYDPAKPVYTVDKSTGECEVTMVTKKVEIPEGTQYHAFFIATPTRPLPEKWRLIRHNDLTRTDAFKLDQIGAKGLLTAPSGFEPHPTQFAAALKNAPPYTVGVYGMANALTTGNPEAVYFRKYWEIPGGTGYVFSYLRTMEDGSQRKERQSSLTACNACAINDLLLYKEDRLLDHEYADRLCMIYYDLCGNDQCGNELHGCAFTDRFGRKIQKFSILEMRELIERTVRLCHARGKLVMLHGQRDYHPMIQGLGDYWFPGEQYERLMAQSLYPYTDVIPEALFRSELNRSVIGTGVILLTCITSQYRATLPDDEVRRATDAMFAMTLLYEIEVSSIYAHVSVCAKVWDALEKYEIEHADTKFHRFDRQQEIKTSNPGVRVSYYECVNNKYVLVLSNRDSDSATAEIDMGGVGKGIREAKEEYTGTDIDVADCKFAITVPSRSFRLVAFPPKPFYPVKDSCSVLWGSWDSGVPEFEFSVDAKVGREEAGSLKLVNKHGNDGCFLKRFPVEQGKTYTASVWVMMQDGESSEIAFQGMNGNDFIDGQPIRSAGAKVDGWGRMEVRFMVPAGEKWKTCDTLLVTLSTKGENAVAWFDDFTMTEE